MDLLDVTRFLYKETTSPQNRSYTQQNVAGGRNVHARHEERADRYAGASLLGTSRGAH